MHLGVYIAYICSFVCIRGWIAHLRSLVQNRKVIHANYRVCGQFENHQESGDHSAHPRVLIAQSEVYGSIREVISAHSKVLGRFVSNQQLRDLFCKLLGNHHWSCSIFFSPDSEHNDDEGADHCGEEMTWTRDPVVEKPMTSYDQRA